MKATRTKRGTSGGWAADMRLKKLKAARAKWLEKQQAPLRKAWTDGVSFFKTNSIGHPMKRLITAGALVVWFVGAGSAQEQSYGEVEYLSSCAVCHGPDGRGDGPLGEELLKRPADLTRLAEKNGGEFPYSRVFAVIDGRFVVPGHGERNMPIWGRQFLEGDAKMYGPSRGEILTTERIHELTEYVQLLQR